MRCMSFIILLYLGYAQCWLWPKGVVHFTINPRHYDPHSQDLITKTLGRVEREICVKFFKLPVNFTMSAANKLQKYVFITNPEQKQDCTPLDYDLNGTVIMLPIGYKCLNDKDITVMFVDLLKATLRGNVDNTYNNYEILREFGNQEPNNDDYLIMHTDRNLINTYYYNECGSLYQSIVPPPKRRNDDIEQHVSPLTFNYYNNFTWPLGVIMYTVVPELHYLSVYQQAIVNIFQEYQNDVL